MVETKKLSGLGVSFGTGVGKAVLIEKEKINIPRYKITDIESESNRFFKALEKIKSETKALYNNETLQHNLTKSEILNAYIMIIEDRRVISEVIGLIQEKNFNAEAAVNDGLDIIVRCFQTIDHDYLKERAIDITDIKNSLLKELLNIKNNDIEHLSRDTILILDELTITDSMKIDFSKVSGIITQKGGKDSHACIIARSFEIPAVFNVSNIFSLVKNGDNVALNGTTGEVFINPDTKKINEYKITNSNYVFLAKTYLQTFKDKPCITADGKKLKLYSNINWPIESKKVNENSADGIGLFRSEFIYMNKSIAPNELEQFEIYKNLARDMSGKNVTIRTVDIGGDKNVPYIQCKKEENPALGYRGIRICLNECEFFKSQLRAILRSSVYGNINILLPMISCISELRLAKNILKEVKNDLDKENIRYNNNIKIGIMIETPAAAVMSDIFAKECDFFSIGTNDLIQYTVAADRNNPLVADLYSPYQPSVLNLINNTIKSATKNNIPCIICGEIASNSLLIPVLIGLGIDRLSVNSNLILKVKKEVSNINFLDAQKLSNKVLHMEDKIEVKKALIKFRKEITLSINKNSSIK